MWCLIAIEGTELFVAVRFPLHMFNRQHQVHVHMLHMAAVNFYMHIMLEAPYLLECVMSSVTFVC